ncbi:MAG: PKD domain-containing protein [Actinomycetota bacterium]
MRFAVLTAVASATAIALVAPPTPTARAAGEYHFTDVTDVAGVADSEHPHFGATWSDYNGDGLLDLYVVNGAGDPFDVEDENVLFRNEGDGTFSDVTVETGTGDPYVAMRNVWADYDRDGDLDLYSHNFQKSTLYQNNANVFTDVNGTSGAGLEMEKGTGAAWGDYDNDGWLDIHATSFPGTNALLHNNGDGTFTDVQPTSGMSLSAAVMGNVWGDFDLDGDLDMALAAVTDQDTTFLYENNGDGTFTDITVAAGIALEEGSSTAAVNWADYDNDGDWDLLITEVAHGGSKVIPNRMYLYENQGDKTFIDATAAAGLTPVGVGDFYDAAFADYDNDGDIDLYVGASDAANIMYQNNGDGTFSDVSTDLGVGLPMTGMGIIWGDYDNDGNLDLYVVQHGGAVPNVLFHNQGGSNNWLQLELKGTVSNPDAIGARVTVVANGQTQMREVSGGSGFFSQHSLVQQFGLGASTTIDSIEIVWPSGIVQNVSGLTINERHLIVEADTGAPTASFTTAAGAAPLDVDFDASASSDDGTIVSYDWDFGDGSIGTGVMTSHSYAAAGSYTAMLTVTDDAGLTGSTSELVTVSDGSNQNPTADFSAVPSGLSVSFTDTSMDVDGAVVAWDWDFGDGSVSPEQNPVHDYAAPGTYDVTLTVTDNDGATDVANAAVVVTDSGGTSVHVGDIDGSTVDGSGGRWNAIATFTVHDADHAPVSEATVAGNWTTGSLRPATCVTDATGTCSITGADIRSTTTSVTFVTTEVTHASLTYDEAMNHDPDADSDGSTIVISHGGNSAPIAGFTSSCTASTCDFSDTSSDADGSVVAWDWDFGDGQSSSLQHPSHAYLADGTYSVMLTVTDDLGAVGSTSSSVVIGEPGTATSIHVADLDGASISQGDPDWLAIVTVTVADDNDVPVEGATVDIEWRSGEVMSCVSGATGMCDVESLTDRGRTSLTVTAVAHSTLTYDPASNMDPDGDSDGTMIEVFAP